MFQQIEQKKKIIIIVCERTETANLRINDNLH